MLVPVMHWLELSHQPQLKFEPVVKQVLQLLSDVHGQFWFDVTQLEAWPGQTPL